MADVLIAEDDADIREWVALALTKAHYRVRTVADGAAALVAYAERRPDILILDIMMPRKSGYDVCIEIRKTAKGTEQDKVLGLDLGADDYLAKPFGLSELKARVAALLRRAAMPPAETPGETIKYGTYVVDVASQRICSADGTETPLTPLELGLLRYLAAHPGEAVSRDKLLNALWGVSYMGTTRTLDQRINLLRKKLGPEADRIETVYGRGYRFRAD